jgi:hypothetical protein
LDRYEENAASKEPARALSRTVALRGGSLSSPLPKEHGVGQL